MQITIKKDEKGFLAEVKNHPRIFAWGKTKTEAKKELGNVIEMMMDYHLEQVEVERKLRNNLEKNKVSYAL